MSKLRADVTFTKNNHPVVIVAPPGGEFTKDELDSLEQAGLRAGIRSLSTVYDISLNKASGQVLIGIKQGVAVEDFDRTVEAKLREYFDLATITRR